MDEFKDIGDFRLSYGSPVKRIKSSNKNRVEGYAVTFDHQDLDKEFFTKSTDFYVKSWEQQNERPVCFEHSLDPVLSALTFGFSDIDIDKRGIYAKAELSVERWAEKIRSQGEEYLKKIMELVDKGVIGWSTGSSSVHARVKKSGEICVWPIVEVSLTPTPADFENKVFAVKSMVEMGEIRQKALKYAVEISKENWLALDSIRQNLRASDELTQQSILMLNKFLDDKTPPGLKPQASPQAIVNQSIQSLTDLERQARLQQMARAKLALLD